MGDRTGRRRDVSRGHSGSQQDYGQYFAGSPNQSRGRSKTRRPSYNALPEPCNANTRRSASSERRKSERRLSSGERECDRKNLIAGGRHSSECKPKSSANARSTGSKANVESIASAATEATRKRAPPGWRAVSAGKFVFSEAPCGDGVMWRPQTSAYNRRVFCYAVATVSYYHGLCAAYKLWDGKPPRTNAELNALLAKASIKINVSEGPDLLKTASTVSKHHHDEDVALPKATVSRTVMRDTVKTNRDGDGCDRKCQALDKTQARMSRVSIHADGTGRRRASSFFRDQNDDTE